VAAPDLSNLATMTTMSEFEDVVLAITYVSADRTIYVERRGDRFRWSIARRDGGGSMLQEIGAYLGVPHDQISVSLQTVDGWRVVRADPEPAEPVDIYGFIQPTSDPAIVGARMLAALSGKV
jgi:hypothetical protein